jgi:AAA15 family ATPase/GTPase
MLLRFRVENHRSLRDEQELSLVAASLSDEARGLIELDKKDAIVPVAAIYGANASGKSNVIHALEFMRRVVVDSHRSWSPEGPIPREPFALDPASASAPTLLEVDFRVAGVRYRYGFVVDSQRVLEEWLYAWPSGRRQLWFARDVDETPHFQFGKHLKGENHVIQNVTRPNSLFLSASAQNNHPQLTPLYSWFARGLRTFRHDSSEFQLLSVARRLVLERSAPSEAPTWKARLLTLLQSSDLGISDVEVDAHSITDLTSRRRWFGPPGDGSRVPLLFTHQTAPDRPAAQLTLEQESRGTATLVALAIPLLDVLAEGGVLCVDELDASLHPLLALQIVELFCDRESNPQGAQLIFNTHDTNLLGNLLDRTPLRRDQIWFTEKDSDGATRLFPLTDFHPRKQENLERGYLQGRYGAVPFLQLLTAGLGEARGA